MRTLGIDPGLNLTGYACLESQDDGPGPPLIVEAGVFRLGKGKSALSDRLVELDTDFRALIDRTRPQIVAIEALFAHYKHPATAIVMGHARGILLLAVARAGLQLLEFKPNAVKKSLTGHGHADKAQMQRAVQAEFNLAEPPRPPDVADAIAIALCACRRPGQGALGGARARRTRTLNIRRLP